MTASEIFDMLAPQYALEANKANYITLARNVTSACYYGDNTETAVALRAAHMFAMRDRASQGGGSGEIASKSEGDLSISYHKSSNSMSGNSDLDLTSFGIQLKGLTKGSGAFIGVTGGNDDGC